MIDLNHGSGCLYCAGAPRPPIAEAVSAVIDAALSARNRAERPRTYVSSSGLGRDCLRQIQYDFLAVPKDEGQEFAPRTLRIFEAGHRAEDIVAGWFRIDGCLVSGPVAMDYPALWENKALGAASWKDVVKRGVSLARPVYAAQIALYQAYMELPAPALFTALNRDTMELYAELVPFDAHLAQEMSDRAVAVVRASEAGEWLPRAAAEPTAVLCRGGMAAGKWHAPCAWAGRCWSERP